MKPDRGRSGERRMKQDGRRRGEWRVKQDGRRGGERQVAPGGGGHRAPRGSAPLSSKCWWKLRSRRLRAESPGPTSPPLVIPNRVRARVPKRQAPGVSPALTGGHREERTARAHTARLYLEPNLQAASGFVASRDGRTNRFPLMTLPEKGPSWNAAVSLSPRSRRILRTKIALPPK